MWSCPKKNYNIFLSCCPPLIAFLNVGLASYFAQHYVSHCGCICFWALGFSSNPGHSKKDFNNMTRKHEPYSPASDTTKKNVNIKDNRSKNNIKLVFSWFWFLCLLLHIGKHLVCKWSDILAKKDNKVKIMCVLLVNHNTTNQKQGKR